MRKCYIHFYGREIVEGLIGTKSEVQEILSRDKNYKYERVQSVRDRVKHCNIPVVVYSIMGDNCSTAFVCYPRD